MTPPLQLPLLPPGLQQMQQLLQNPFGAINPAQIQQLMQQNVNQLADSGRKQLEQLIPQLQEQLQVNFVQQTHLLQSDRSKSSPGLQHLQMQQQQLISQLQLVQQRLIMVPTSKYFSMFSLIKINLFFSGRLRGISWSFRRK